MRTGLALLILMLGLCLWEPYTALTQVAPAPLKHDARIVRDAFGVPHIYGRTDADTAYGLAYAHSEDDFETLQEVLAMTRGRAGAMLGADGAKADYILALLNARATAERDYPTLPDDVRAMVDGYARGLNHFAETHPSEVRLRGLFPVSGTDIVAGFVLRSPFFFGLDSTVQALMKDEPLPWSKRSALTPAGREPDKNGSNAFAIAPKRMSDGQTWLISNSHQPYEGGVAWYEAAVHSGQGLDMAGALFPGSPFVLLGHNRNLGWTNTVNRPDLIDVYKLVLDEDGTSYRLDGAWKPIEKHRVWMKVRFGPFVLPWPMSVERTLDHGPVIRNTSGAFAIRYAGIDNSRMVEQYYRIGRAQDYASWTQAMTLSGVPATNFIYADKTGRIAYFYNAMFPDRAAGYDWSGILPGDTSKAIWSTYLPFSRVPAVINPASGFVQNANNTPYLTAGPGSELNPADFAPEMGMETAHTNRGLRAVELLAADTSITPAELLTIKFDTRYSKASFVGPWMATLAKLDLKDDADLARAQALLATWDWSSDGKGEADTLAEALIHMAAKANWRGLPLPDARTSLREAVDDLKQNFGRIDPPLLEVQRLRRGTVDMPMDGGQDTLRAATIWDKQDDGHKRVKHGDSFIQIVHWDRQGRFQTVSVQPYGAATTRPASPHYTDQMALFTRHQFKPVPFERDAVIRQSKRAYRVNN